MQGTPAKCECQHCCHEMQARSACWGALEALIWIFYAFGFGMCEVYQQLIAGTQLMVLYGSVLAVYVISLLGIVMTRLWHQNAKSFQAFIIHQVTFFC